jgi:hypothetical protein
MFFGGAALQHCDLGFVLKFAISAQTTMAGKQERNSQFQAIEHFKTQPTGWRLFPE